MSERKKVARWRKQPNEGGLRSIGQCPRGFELRLGGEVIIRVWPNGGGWSRPLDGWHWTGLGVTGTGSGKFSTAEEAKANADAYYKNLRKQWLDAPPK